MSMIPDTLNADTLRNYLALHENKTLLKFLTCGSVDDGKSTLIGRILYDTKLVLEDQWASLEKDSKKHGTIGDEVDLALLVDGLVAEREQGITIDVAYRFFTTSKRKFIVADTPGHEQYTRNMATGASQCDLAVILIDARKGLLTQTRRHSYIVSLLGIKHIVLAVNKIDLMDYSQEVFDNIVTDYQRFVADFGFDSIIAIPMSARYGDNVLMRSQHTPWHNGPTLIEHLEAVDIDNDAIQKPFRMQVQWVNRPDLNFRGFCGTVSSGVVRPGDKVVIARSGLSSTIKTITTYDADKPYAQAHDAVTLTLDDEIDISRGDIIAQHDNRPEVSDQFQAHLIWMGDEPMIVGRSYLLKIGTKTLTATIMDIKHKIDVNSLQKLAAKTLILNEVACVHLTTKEPIGFEPYAENHAMGGFILIDRMSNATLGAGMIDFGLHRASNVHWQAIEVSKASRCEIKSQKPCLIWLTGLSGSGKSTIANLVEKKLIGLGHHTYLLDGDNVRHGLNKDLGFTTTDRVENIRRVAEVAKLMLDAGLITIASFISPFESERQMAREMLSEGEFIEVFVSTPLEIAEARDVKGLYKRARLGQIKNFTGIDSPYQEPKNAEIILYTQSKTPEALADEIIDYLRQNGFIAL